MEAGTDGSDAANSPDAGNCVTDLSNIGTGNFRISFTLTTTAFGVTVPIVSQRANCGAPFWDVSLRPSGDLVVSTNDGTRDAFVTGDRLNDGTPHQIVIERTNGQLSYADNGVVLTSAPNDIALGALPPLAIGTSGCAGATPLAGHGTLAELCITR